MPERKTALLIGVDGSLALALASALASSGLDIGETSGSIALVHVRGAQDHENLLAISAAKCPVVAIINPEDSDVLEAVTLAGVHGILDLPLRRAAVPIQVALAHATTAHQKRLENKAALLERTLKSRQIIEKATHVVATLRGITPADAYEQLRQTSMSRRVSMAQAAEDYLLNIAAATENPAA